MRIKKITALITLTAYHILPAQEESFIVDPRDGQEYKTVTYQTDSKSITWMAENLRFKTADSYCFDDFESNCKIMGRLYS